MRNHFIAASLVFTLLTGCALIRQNDAPMKEQMLLSAGFQARPADTAKKKADLASMTPYHIQVTNHKGKSLYLYADPKRNVIYAGGRKAYAAYKKASVQADIAAERQMNDMEWGYWASTYGYGFAGNPSVIY